jgi:hypothetical protein
MGLLRVRLPSETTLMVGSGKSRHRVFTGLQLGNSTDMKKSIASLALLALVAGAADASAQFVINSSTGLFDPSFRGGPNTTWFGWGPGRFEGTTANELIDNPAPNIGTTLTGTSFTQNPANDILASSDNIYSGAAAATDLLLAIPTSGTIGSGFTTIIIQGRTAFGGYDTAPSFQPISGINPLFEVGANANGSGQFWAKYELPGNLASYDLTVNLPAASFISIAEFEFDTQWSATSFAADVAVVPEPGTIALSVLGGLALLFRVQKLRGSRTH